MHVTDGTLFGTISHWVVLTFLQGSEETTWVWDACSTGHSRMRTSMLQCVYSSEAFEICFVILFCRCHIICCIWRFIWDRIFSFFFPLCMHSNHCSSVLWSFLWNLLGRNPLGSALIGMDVFWTLLSTAGASCCPYGKCTLLLLPCKLPAAVRYSCSRFNPFICFIYWNISYICLSSQASLSLYICSYNGSIKW